MKHLFLVLALLLTVLPRPALAADTDTEFFRRIGPRQAALLIDGELVAIVELVRLDDRNLRVKISGASGSPVKDWIASSLNMDYQRKSGQIVAGDFNRRQRNVRQFRDALLTNITFPSGDGAADEAGSVTFDIFDKGDHGHPGGKSSEPIDFSVMDTWQPTRFHVVPCYDGICR